MHGRRRALFLLLKTGAFDNDGMGGENVVGVHRRFFRGGGSLNVELPCMCSASFLLGATVWVGLHQQVGRQLRDSRPWRREAI